MFDSSGSLPSETSNFQAADAENAKKNFYQCHHLLYASKQASKHILITRKSPSLNSTSIEAHMHSPVYGGCFL